VLASLFNRLDARPQLLIWAGGSTSALSAMQSGAVDAVICKSSVVLVVNT
jgi:hypothetical protein